MPYVPLPPVLASGVAESINPNVQNLLLAGRAIGLDANLVTLPLWSATSARKILGLPTVGQTLLRRPTRLARGRYGPTIRKSVEQVTHLDGYGNRAWLDS